MVRRAGSIPFLKMDKTDSHSVVQPGEIPQDNVGDLDGDGLPDEWEIMMGLSPRTALRYGAYGNPDGDWFLVETNPPTLVSIIDDSELAGW